MKLPVPARADLPPPGLALLAEWPRAAWGLGRLAIGWRGLQDAPRGDGRPVMVLPGLFNTDRSNLVLRRYLNGLGYRAIGWGLGRNLGARTIGGDGARLFARVAEVHAEMGVPLTLIGVSLGGIMARIVAHRHPDMVRQVITISSPFAGSPTATNVWRQFQWLTGERISDAAVTQRLAEAARPLPVPSAALWSRSDGLVNGLICREPDGGDCRAIEIRSSHLFVQMKPETLRAVAALLADQRGSPE
ncbi:esterase/lipase family protein [Sphingomonas sp. CJ20]